MTVIFPPPPASPRSYSLLAVAPRPASEDVKMPFHVRIHYGPRRDVQPGQEPVPQRDAACASMPRPFRRVRAKGVSLTRNAHLPAFYMADIPFHGARIRQPTVQWYIAHCLPRIHRRLFFSVRFQTRVLVYKLVARVRPMKHLKTLGVPFLTPSTCRYASIPPNRVGVWQWCRAPTRVSVRARRGNSRYARPVLRKCYATTNTS